jgi:hypothetical protein
LFLHFLDVRVRILLELLDTGGAAEINSVSLMIDIDVFVDQSSHHRALGLVSCPGSDGKGEKG